MKVEESNWAYPIGPSRSIPDILGKRKKERVNSIWGTFVLLIRMVDQEVGSGTEENLKRV